jgi:HPt (histidine-containing phosphotransfer) domain-containing protein
MCSHFEQRSNPMDTGHLLDVDATLTELGGDETLLGKIADIFTRTAPNLIELIHEALAAQDLKRVYGEAHSLKGSVGAFKAPEVFQCIADLAQHAREGNLGAAQNDFSAAQPLVKRLLDELAPIVAAARAAAGPRAR